jgi:hypothetical protein
MSRKDTEIQGIAWQTEKYIAALFMKPQMAPCMKNNTQKILFRDFQILQTLPAFGCLEGL